MVYFIVSIDNIPTIGVYKENKFEVWGYEIKKNQQRGIEVIVI